MPIIFRYVIRINVILTINMALLISFSFVEVNWEEM